MNELETTIDRNAEWKTSMDLMRGLFPKWVVSIEQLRSWKEKFGMMNPDWFREALNLVYHKYNSDTPKPKWVHEAFIEIRANHRGIATNETDAAHEQQLKAIEERQREMLLAEIDRDNAWKTVASWSDSERQTWGARFKANYKFLADGRNDVSEFDTWNKTFTQFVKVYREREESLMQ